MVWHILIFSVASFHKTVEQNQPSGCNCFLSLWIAVMSSRNSTLIPYKWSYEDSPKFIEMAWQSLINGQIVSNPLQYPLVNQHNYGKSQFPTGRLTISMAMASIAMNWHNQRVSSRVSQLDLHDIPIISLANPIVSGYSRWSSFRSPILAIDNGIVKIMGISQHD